MTGEDDFTIRPGKIRSRGSKGGLRALTLAGQIIQYSLKGGYARSARRGSGTGHQARGRGPRLPPDRAPPIAASSSRPALSGMAATGFAPHLSHGISPILNVTV
jgi:hypothetical protein